MGRRFRLRALGLVVFSTALAAGCSSKREVLATDRQDDVEEPGFVDPDAAPPPPPVTGRDASTVGMCATNECPSGRTTCANNPFPCAVDLLNDNDNCGACGRHCPRSTPYMTSVNAFTKCVEGECQPVCLVTNADCNGVVEDGCETNISRDKNNCGGCGIQCADICDNGECGCRDGEYCPDSNMCKLLDRDNQNCGACGNVCPPNPHGPPPTGASRSCVQGTCNALACQNLRFDCNKNLFEPDTDGCEVNGASDVNNCGGCGNVCDAGQRCFNGNCLCDSGMTLCSTSTCTYIESDVNNCGSCGVQCPGDRRSIGLIGIAQDPDPAHGRPVCEQGVCDYRCSPNWGDCDGNSGNGCEVKLLDDPLNCGACGVRCNGVEGQACVNGQCVMKPCDEVVQ